MREIQLSNCHETTLVDDEDFPWLNEYRWYKASQGYAVHTFTTRYRGRRAYIHRVIMNPDDGLEIDHIDLNKLNNQKNNLRICARLSNGRNMPGWSKPTSSQYKGVSWDKQRSKWRACICVNYKTIHLGSFDLERDAALAYNVAAIVYFGEFVHVNVIH